MQTPSPGSSVRCRLVRSDTGVLWTQNPMAHCTPYNSTKARPHHCILTKIIGQSVPAGKRNAHRSAISPPPRAFTHLVCHPRAVSVHEKVCEKASCDGRAGCKGWRGTECADSKSCS